MSLANFIKRVRDIMRKDDGVGTNEVLVLEQLTWLLFLFIYDYKEDEWELYEGEYESIIPERFRWRNWAPNKDEDGKEIKEALTGESLLHFIDRELIPALKTLQINERTPRRKAIVKALFQDANNYMKSGTNMRKVINIINELDFDEQDERHQFNYIYEEMLVELQSAGRSGQYFTPRALTSWINNTLNPEIGEDVADMAGGTGGFLVSAYEILKSKAKTEEDYDIINKSIYGIEKFHLPYLLGVTNLILHGIDSPRYDHDNAFSKNTREFTEKDKFDVICMNPPFGSKSEEKIIQNNFPAEFQSSETADLFMALIMLRLKKDGRAGVILPDGFMFGDGVKNRLKEKLLNEFNLHTIIRLPGSVFAPYTSISTNVLFFDNNGTGTEDIWYYELPLPEGYKAFSKTKPMQVKHLDEITNWWNDRQETEQAWKVSKEDIVQRNFNLDMKNPNAPAEESHDPVVLLEQLCSVNDDIKALQETLIDELKSVL